MPDVRLPGTLTPLFAGLPRRVEVDAATVLEAIDRLEARWPGLRDRILEEGPPDRIFSDPREPRTREFLARVLEAERLA